MSTSHKKRASRSHVQPRMMPAEPQLRRLPATNLSSLRETTMMSTKSALPAEIMASILDFVAIPDLLRCARTSKRMQEMVYDDTRWVQKLRAMGCWNETEARQRTADAARQKRGDTLASPKKTDPAGRGSNGGVLFDAVRDDQSKARPNGTAHATDSLSNGFDAITLSPTRPAKRESLTGTGKEALALAALDKVRSVRGAARVEYGRIYGRLAPYYLDLVTAESHEEPQVFRVFKDPQQQAKMLANLRIFAKSDITIGSLRREQALHSMSGLFENAALREFEQAYTSLDYDGNMRKYAHVLVELNGGNAAIDSYIHNHSLMRGKRSLGDPLDCIHHAFQGQVNLNPSRDFFERLANALNSDVLVVDRVFPPSANVLMPFLDRIGDDIISDYITPLFDECHGSNKESYLKVVTGVFEQSLQFIKMLRYPNPKETSLLTEKATMVVNKCFEPHIDLYLSEELDDFTSKADAEVERWNKKLHEQQASAESFFMSNVQRQAVKRDFLTSFKKVLMMPVNVLPSMTNTAPSKTPLPSASTAGALSPHNGSRSASPAPPDTLATLGDTRSISPRPGGEAPTTELAAKAAIMNSKLEGIASLFSIEVALTLVHAARGTIGRAAPFVRLRGKYGAEAKEQCETIFVQLLQILGSKHVQPGFDTAVGHLSLYKAREATSHSNSGVQPLVTFLELVNVGDLIQQMVDVFFVQELVHTRLSEADDFLNPAAKEKKKFEQMLDERVAAGLNAGIDALIDEVEFLCGSTQAATDFNPGAAGPAAPASVDVGPTPTAAQVTALVAHHVGMLEGSTDKTLLDIFRQEVGLRLFATLCKHLKRQRISVPGAIRLISDVNAYFDYVQTLRNKELLRYFRALRELAQIFLVDGSAGKEIATIIADGDRYQGIFRAEEVYEFAERRADWYLIRGKVEKHMYGFGCAVM